MGEDFIRKTERTYRRSLQRTVAKRLFAPPLLRTPEITSTTYPCRLTTPLTKPGAPLLLHRQTDRTIQLLDTHLVIGTVVGEALQDLNEYLDQRPDCANVLKVRATSTDGEFLDVIVEEPLA